MFLSDFNESSNFVLWIGTIYAYLAESIMGSKRRNHGRIQSEGTGSPDPLPLEKSQKYWISLQYWSGSPENHKAIKPAFNVGPSSAGR